MSNTHLIGSPRCGTTYMNRVIQKFYAPNTIKNESYGELFNEPFGNMHENDPNNKNKYYVDLFNEINQWDKVCIKSHYYHLDILNDYGFINNLYDLKCYNIVMIRKNIWNTSLSLSIAQLKDEWFDYKDTSTIKIDTDFHRKSINLYFQNLIGLYENKYKLNYNEIIYYEDLTFDPKIDFLNTKLCKRTYDKLPDIYLGNHFKKSPSKKDTVINYDELYEFTKEHVKYCMDWWNIDWMTVNDNTEICEFPFEQNN